MMCHLLNYLERYRSDICACKCTCSYMHWMTNVTLIFSANQALLAARAGATYVSPFLGRLDDISTDGVELIQQIAEMFAVADIPTEIIAEAFVIQCM